MSEDTSKERIAKLEAYKDSMSEQYGREHTELKGDIRAIHASIGNLHKKFDAWVAPANKELGAHGEAIRELQKSSKENTKRIWTFSSLTAALSATIASIMK